MNDQEWAAHLADRPSKSSDHRVVVISAGPVDGVMNRLLLHFEAHPDDELEIRRDRTTLGYLTAAALYATLANPTRGLGDADHYGLLGLPEDELLVLRCPECDYSLSVVLLHGEPPRCPRHPETELGIHP
jgi:hypothetical protein